MKNRFNLFLAIFISPFLGYSQIFIGFSPADTINASHDSTSISNLQPDADRNDIPFVDYKPAVIWNTPTDSVSDYAYIRKNFTDQMVSVWNYPRRLYPASRIYGIDMDGKHYQSVKVSNQNYVFAEQLVKGKMNLFIYRKIPQMNGWLEFRGYDSIQSGYRNFMIVEQDEMRGKQNYFGYYVSISNDTLRSVSASNMKLFADTYLNETPEAKAMAMKFAVLKMNKTRKIAVASLMTVGIVGLALTGGTGASLVFLAGFPLAAVVAYLNKPHTLHWEDMVEIVNTYNKEKGK